MAERARGVGKIPGIDTGIDLDKKMSRRTALKLGIASALGLGLTAAGLSQALKDDDESPAALPVVDPTATDVASSTLDVPASQVADETGTAGVVGAEDAVDPTAASTEEIYQTPALDTATPYSTATLVPATETPKPPSATPEASPTPDRPLYELGWTQDFGNFVLGIDRKIIDRETNWVRELYLDTETFPDAEEMTNEGFRYMHFLGWQSNDGSRADVSFDEYKAMKDSGEDMRYTILANKDKNALLSECTVDPDKKVHVSWVDNKTVPYYNFFSTRTSGARQLDDELHLEIWEQYYFVEGNGYYDPNTDTLGYKNYQLNSGMLGAMAYVTLPEVQNLSGVPSLDFIKGVIRPRVNDIGRFSQIDLGEGRFNGCVKGR